jgi:predicted transcriptional regulator
MFDFKNYVKKITSQSPSQYLVTLQGKIKAEKNLHIRKFLLYFSIVQCTSHQPISVADLGYSVNHVKSLISPCLQNLISFFISLGGGGGEAAAGQ